MSNSTDYERISIPLLKTTIYLPSELKTAVKRVAKQRGVSQAEVIRESIRAGVSQARPRPRAHDGEGFSQGQSHLPHQSLKIGQVDKLPGFERQPLRPSRPFVVKAAIYFASGSPASEDAPARSRYAKS